MERLEVRNGKIRDARGKQVPLRGTCVGGWMNMENFINGYPGDESGTRVAMAQALGPAKAEFFFDRVLQSFALKNCRPNDGLVGVLQKHMKA